MEEEGGEESDGTLRSRKRILFSQTASNSLLDTDITPAKKARLTNASGTTDLTPADSDTDDDNDVAKLTKITSEFSLASKRREERKRSSEKGYDSCSSTSSPIPKRMMNPEKSADGKSK